MATMSSIPPRKVEASNKKELSNLCKEMIDVTFHGNIAPNILSSISRNLSANAFKDNDSNSLTKELFEAALHGELNPNLLGRVGESLAIKALEENGFKKIIPIEDFQPNLKKTGTKIRYGHVIATWNGKKYVIAIKTRMKYTGKGDLNYRYNLVRKDQVQDQVIVDVSDQEKARIFYSMVNSFYNAIPAWIAVSIDNTQEKSDYAIYFETAEMIKWNLGIPMQKTNLNDYNCLAENKKVTNLIEPNRCDILLITPLREEFDLLEPTFHTKFHEKNDIIYYYLAKSPKSSYKINCILLGKTGPMHAAAKTVSALLYCQPRLVVLIGFGGALDKDLLLGDVVVGDEINLYYADAKAIDDDDKYIFRYASRHWLTKANLTGAVENFSRTSSELFENWQKQVNRYRNKMSLDKINSTLTHEFPALTLGRVASGDIVGASESFSAEILDTIDRKLKVLEMEAAGVAEACVEREAELDFIIIRGISDFADKRKGQIDNTKRGAFRRLAMFSAINFFLTLIQSQDFQDIYPPNISN